MSNIVYGDDISCGIKKKVLYPSKFSLPSFEKDTKLYFLYQTRLCNDEKTVIDDNRKDKKPLELIIGKKFKLEVWETCLKSMKPTEVASFIVDSSLVATYPILSKSLREIRSGKVKQARHCCGMSLKDIGLGHEDLDNLMKNPQPLEFIFELLKIEEPGQYNKDLWALGEDEKMGKVPELKEEGNNLFKNKNYSQAAEKYGQAIGLLDQLSLREKPGDEDFNRIEAMKIPFLLNYSQCKLLLNDFYDVIKQTSEVIEKDPDNIKALFRRAKAHIGAWNPQDAKVDLEKVKTLDPSLNFLVSKELKRLSELEKEKSQQDKKLLRGKMFN